MAKAERELIQARLRALTEDQRRFRINAGQGWAGDVAHIARDMMVHVHPGDVVIRQARVFHGAPIGWPDLAGWDSVVITPDMVGQRVAVFVGEEFKTPGVRLTREQGIFGRVLSEMGGRFEVMR
jgi:hypothetical protein